MSASTPTASPSTASLAARLSRVRVGVREDLEVSRHLFRDEVSYVVRDPITFHTQRLDLADYQMFVRIKSDRTLGEIFSGLVRDGRLTEEDESSFFQFILSLHGLGFLRLPIADDKLLYRRHQAKQEAQKRQMYKSLLFLRVPLYNPNDFLDRTIGRVRPLFHATFFCCWLILITIAIFTALHHHDRLRQPLEGIFILQNLPLLWITLIVLKLFHEFGHAYACKHFGGHVPEMGAYFILFTPCAYMDATASWGFPRRRDRIIVCLAGVYVESIIAAIAVFVWAATDASVVHSLAYNVIFLAGTVTVLFNVNPLMRYDGYYILSDLLGVPNLRQRSACYVMGLAKRWFLGIPLTDQPMDSRLRSILFWYGLLAGLYRVALLAGIAALLIGKWFFVGMLLALIFLGGITHSMLRRIIQYLFRSPETALCRFRAVTVCCFMFLVLPLAVMFIPLPGRVQATGVLEREKETVVRAEREGFLEDLSVRPGCVVRPGDPIARLSNDAWLDFVAEAESVELASRLRADAYRPTDPTLAMSEDSLAQTHHAAWMEARRKLQGLNVLAPAGGRVQNGLTEDHLGRLIREGEPLVWITTGAWRVRAALTEEQLVKAVVQVGEEIQFLPAADPSRILRGRVRSISPAGLPRDVSSTDTQAIESSSARNGSPDNPEPSHFELVIDLEPNASAPLRHGMSGSVLLSAPAEPIAILLHRRILRFFDKAWQR